MTRSAIALSTLLLAACSAGDSGTRAQVDPAEAGSASVAPEGAPTSAEPVGEPTPAESQFVVHEWGTFTARMNDDGTLRTWTAADRVEPLPKFVYESWMTSAKQQAKGTVRMETPVLYFYNEGSTRVSAEVAFPGGFLTEWYPAAEHEDTIEVATLRWPLVNLEPGPDPEYPVDGDSHYYAARDTDAVPLVVGAGDDRQREKMLFYRGVGTFDLPLDASWSKAGLELTSPTPLDGVVVFHREGDAIGFEVVERMDGPTTVQDPALDDSLDELTTQVETLLVAQGLYPREAAAMVATWRDLWFEDGTRVLYMVPRTLTDDILPLTLEPTPDELVRVLVGRLDLP